MSERESYCPKFRSFTQWETIILDGKMWYIAEDVPAGDQDVEVMIINQYIPGKSDIRKTIKPEHDVRTMNIKRSLIPNSSLH